MPTIKDVASAAGVSIGTVSAVINGKSSVKASTRRRVNDAIRRLDYHPNTLARALYQKKQTKMLAFLVPDIANPGFSNILRSIEKEARERGYSILVGNTEGSEQYAKEHLDRLIGIRIDGVLLTLTWDLTRPEIIGSLHRNNIRVVGAASARPLPEIDCFLYDEVKGAYNATKYLYSLGHRNIAFIVPEQSAIGEKRFQGIKTAMGEMDIEFDEDILVVTPGYDETASYKATLELVSSGKQFTSVIAFNDRLAIGVLKALYEQGFDVPNDVSVMAFGDSFARITRPQLSAVAYPEEELGRQAISHLIAIIENGQFEPPQTRVLEPKLVLRESTRRLRKELLK